jgi:hypothetical protein
MIFCHEEQDVPVCTWLLFLDLFCILLNQERGRTKRVGCMLVISSLWPLLKFFSGVPPMIANSDSDTFLLQTRVFKFLFPWHPYCLPSLVFLVIVFAQGLCTQWDWTVRPFFYSQFGDVTKQGMLNPPNELELYGYQCGALQALIWFCLAEQKKFRLV